MALASGLLTFLVHMSLAVKPLLPGLMLLTMKCSSQAGYSSRFCNKGRMQVCWCCTCVYACHSHVHNSCHIQAAALLCTNGLSAGHRLRANLKFAQSMLATVWMLLHLMAASFDVLCGKLAFRQDVLTHHG
eukprot:GHRR01031520.1.p1 GENE.GHRR01031520.1~~GHRR01031520.1.p1  ORF type:complete len:131 (-),score=43.21 GHRR01031520.1:839-1231(-)